jgi:transcriptional regulator with GAF, ATPase, and Fis domain
MQVEPQRLAANQRTLLEAMPDPVLLVHGSGVIEYMNPCALAIFSGIAQRPGKKAMQDQLQPLIESLRQPNALASPEPLTVQGQKYSCHIAKFAGYKGDNLFWLVLKNLAEQQPGPGSRSAGKDGAKNMIGSSAELERLREQAVQVAQTEANVLITGESGTGKELVADLIQAQSCRKDKPYLTINCTNISDDLLESDLFGHEKGSFTGASSRKKGKFEAVDGGTLFLDEIGDISPKVQSSLLRVLQYGEIFRVGGNEPVKVDVRIIAATNRDLQSDVREHRFRLDLYYRLNTLQIFVPPLRQRKGDVLELAEYFLHNYVKLFGKSIRFKPEEIRAKLETYDWPGNIRELENVIQRAVLVNKSGNLGNKDLQFDSMTGQNGSTLSSMVSQFNGNTLKGIVDQIEREVILQSLARNGGDVSGSAEELHISKAALYAKMRRYEISAKILR